MTQKKFAVYLLVLILQTAIFKSTTLTPVYAATTNLIKTASPKILTKPKASQVKKFISQSDFKNYLKKSKNLSDNYFGSGLFSRSVPLVAPLLVTDEQKNSGNLASANKAAFAAGQDQNQNSSLPMLERFSQTNNQVVNIDEPDIVKTDGANIYYSTEWQKYYLLDTPNPVSNKDLSAVKMPVMQNLNATYILNALPANSPSSASKIPQNGQLLLSGNMLVIFQPEQIFGFDVTDKNNPKEIWNIKYENNNRLVSARLLDNKIYLLTQSTFNENIPCPIKPLSLQNKLITVPCAEIYHPISVVPDAASFSAFAVNVSSGKVEKNLNFVASGNMYQNTPVFYMSENAMYLTYKIPGDDIKFMSDFLKQRAQDLIPLSIIYKIDKLISYDISYPSKLNELAQILQKYKNTLSSDEQARVENELNNRVQNFAELHKREMEKFGLIKISLSDFKIIATTELPGAPLNQFSLDEYLGNLRVAVTVGGQWRQWGRTESASDVYVLNNQLNILGQINDLGKTEKIYSTRFIGQRGYLVTFRQTDPFYVLDLSNPAAPKMTGELKIPGYSSYLHPLSVNKILGVGMENSKVKLSLFDVSDAQNPKEISKYLLDAYWSEVSNNHHAFLQDSKHNIVFLPADQNAYIISYAGDNLSLSKVIASVSEVKRALYINDSLYILGEKMVVVDENTWERVGELEIK